MQMVRRGEKKERGKSEEVISALLNAGAEYMNTGSGGSRGERSRLCGCCRTGRV